MQPTVTNFNKSCLKSPQKPDLLPGGAGSVPQSQQNPQADPLSSSHERVQTKPEHDKAQLPGMGL